MINLSLWRGGNVTHAGMSGAIGFALANNLPLVNKHLSADIAGVVEDPVYCYKFFLLIHRIEKVVVAYHHTPKEWVNLVGLADIRGFL